MTRLAPTVAVVFIALAALNAFTLASPAVAAAALALAGTAFALAGPTPRRRQLPAAPAPRYLTAAPDPGYDRDAVAALTDADWAALEAAGGDVSWRPRAEPKPVRALEPPRPPKPPKPPRPPRPPRLPRLARGGAVDEPPLTAEEMAADRFRSRAANVQHRITRVRYRAECPSGRCTWSTIVDSHDEVADMHRAHLEANPGCDPTKPDLRRRPRRYPRL